jgi:hypothetical protein
VVLKQNTMLLNQAHLLHQQMQLQHMRDDESHKQAVTLPE